MIVKYKDKAISTKKLSQLSFPDVYSYFYKDTFKFLVECVCLLVADNVLKYRKKAPTEIGVIENRLLISHISQIIKIERLLNETIYYHYQFNHAKKNGGELSPRVKAFLFTKKDLQKKYPPREVIALIRTKGVN